MAQAAQKNVDLPPIAAFKIEGQLTETEGVQRPVQFHAEIDATARSLFFKSTNNTWCYALVRFPPDLWTTLSAQVLPPSVGEFALTALGPVRSELETSD